MTYSTTQPPSSSDRSGSSSRPAALANFGDLRAPGQEAALAGFLLISGSQHALEVFDVLKPEHATDTLAKAVIEAGASLFRVGLDINPDSVSDAMRGLGTYAQVGGAEALERLESLAALDLPEALAAAEAVRGYAQRRALYTFGRDVSGAALNLSVPLEDVQGQAEVGLLNCTMQDSRSRRPESLEVLLPPVMAEMEARGEGLTLPGVPCGFYDLDAMTQGFQRSDLILVGGRPSQGKTALVLNIARNIAVVQRLPVLVFSLEMSKQQLVYRLISGETAIETSRLKAGRLGPNEWATVSSAIGNLSEAPLYIDDSPSISVSEMRSKSRRLQAEEGALGMIMVDYLQLMEGAGDNRVQELAKITRALKGLARELCVPIIALSQLHRGVESRQNKRPVMSDLKESGSLEQDADVIMMLYREEYYDPDTPDRGIAEIIITKHRNGPTGTVRLLFEPQYTRFRNLASPSGYQPAPTYAAATASGMSQAADGINEEFIQGGEADE